MTDLGTDLALILVDGVLDLDPTGRLVSGRAALAQTIAARLSTPTGRLELVGDDPEAGYALTELVNDTLDARGRFVVAARVQAECLRDERVLAAQVTAVASAGEGLLVTIRLTDSAGPFSLVLAVSAVSVSVLKVTR